MWSNTVNLTVSTPNITSVTPTTAIAGTQITITGTGFGASQGSGNVWLGSTYGMVVSWSDTQVVANVASGSKSGVAQILQGGVWSNTVNLTVSTPNIASVTPTTAIAGMQITITGTGFGANQGSGNVWLGSTYGVVVSWSDTQIVANVASGSSSGVAQVLQGGVWSNTVTLTVITPNISSVTPASAQVGTQVTITGTGFGASQGTGNVWLGSTYGIVVSWSDNQVIATVASGSNTGVAQILQGGVWSNSVSFTVSTSTAPPVISAISPTSGGIGTAVTISGSAFGSSQNQSTITFNGIPARILSWSDTTIVAGVPSGLSPGTATVVVNGNSVASNGVPFTVTNPLYVHPSKTTMTVGQARPIQVLDENGAVISNPSWTFDNSSIAEILPPVNPGDPTLLQADSVGTTTLVAGSGDRTGITTITVLAAGSALPVGTVQWQVPSLGGGTISRTLQALRVDDNSPDLYVEDDGALGGFGGIRALTADGQQKWIWPSTASFSNPDPILLAGDDQGGAIYLAITPDDNQFGGPGYIGRVDENGNESWQYPWGGRFNDRSNPQYAIHPDGTIYLVDDNYQGTFTSYVVALDPATGQPKFTIPLPSPGQLTIQNATPVSAGNPPPRTYYGQFFDYCTPGTSFTLPDSTPDHGFLTISSDGTVYLPIGYQARVLDGQGCDPSPDPFNPGYPHVVDAPNAPWSLMITLSLMVIQPDGSFAIQGLDGTSDTGTNWLAVTPSRQMATSSGSAIPDGQGGALYPGLNSLYHFTGSGTSTVALPIIPAPQTFGTDGQDPVLLGEDGTAYVAGSDTAGNDSLTAVDSLGTVKWTSSSLGKSPRLSAVMADGSLVFQSMQADNAMHVSIADPKGNISPLFASPADGSDIGPAFALPFPCNFYPGQCSTTSPSYWTLGTWHVPDSTGGIDSVTGNNSGVSGSVYTQDKGNRQNQHSAPKLTIATFMPSIPGAPGPGPFSTEDSAIAALNTAIPASRASQAIYALTTHLNPPKTGVAAIDTFLRANGTQPMDILGFIGHADFVTNPANNLSTADGLVFVDNRLLRTPDCTAAGNVLGICYDLDSTRRADGTVGSPTPDAQGNCVPPAVPIASPFEIGVVGCYLLPVRLDGTVARTTSVILTSAKIVFVAACDTGNLFTGWWEMNLNAAPGGRALVVPDISTMSTLQANQGLDVSVGAIDILQGAVAYQTLMNSIAAGKTVQRAVDEANAAAATFYQTPEVFPPGFPKLAQVVFKVVGNPNVCINCKKQ